MRFITEAFCMHIHEETWFILDQEIWDAEDQVLGYAIFSGGGDDNSGISRSYIVLRTQHRKNLGNLEPQDKVLQIFESIITRAHNLNMGLPRFVWVESRVL